MLKSCIYWSRLTQIPPLHRNVHVEFNHPSIYVYLFAINFSISFLFAVRSLHPLPRQDSSRLQCSLRTGWHRCWSSKSITPDGTCLVLGDKSTTNERCAYWSSRWWTYLTHNRSWQLKHQRHQLDRRQEDSVRDLKLDKDFHVETSFDLMNRSIRAGDLQLAMMGWFDSSGNVWFLRKLQKICDECLYECVFDNDDEDDGHV